MHCRWCSRNDENKKCIIQKYVSLTQTLNPRLFLLPLAFSNFLPLARTYGFVLLCGTPGAGPKCFTASLAFLGPLRKTCSAWKFKQQHKCIPYVNLYKSRSPFEVQQLQVCSNFYTNQQINIQPKYNKNQLLNYNNKSIS